MAQRVSALWKPLAVMIVIAGAARLSLPLLSTPDTSAAGDLSLAGPVGAPSLPASSAGSITVTVQCKVTGGQKTFTCQDPADCPADAAEVYCRDAWSRFYGGVSSEQVYGWLEGGVWEHKKGTWALTEAFDAGEPTTVTVEGAERPGLSIATLLAERILYRNDGAAIERTSTARTGLGGPSPWRAALIRFAQYDTSNGTDRLAMELGALFEGPEVYAQLAAWELHLVHVDATRPMFGVQEHTLAETYRQWPLTEGLADDDRKSLLLILGLTASAVNGAVEARDAKLAAAAHTALEADPWERLTSVARPWDRTFGSAVTDARWALPSANACPSSSDSAQTMAYLAAEERKRGKDPAKVAAEVQRFARIMPLEIKSAATGRFTRVPVTIASTEEFVLTNGIRRKSTPDCWMRCYPWEDSNEYLDVYESCSGKLRRVCGKPDGYWDGGVIAARLDLPAELSVTDGWNIDGVEGEAVVVVSKVHRACDNSLDDMFGGQLLGYRVQYKGEDVLRVINRDVSVDEALAGPDEFNPSARAKRKR